MSESRDRVDRAFTNPGVMSPFGQTPISVSPVDVMEDGPGFERFRSDFEAVYEARYCSIEFWHTHQQRRRRLCKLGLAFPNAGSYPKPLWQMK